MKISKNMCLQSIAWITLLALTAVGCKTDPVPAAPAEKAPTALSVPAFNRDSAYAFVEKQVSFGPRHMGSEGHEDCKEWLIYKMEAFGLQVKSQNFSAQLFDGSKHPATNIIGTYNPSNGHRIVLAAHWDTRQMAEKDPNPERRDDPILGADDGASGVAVLLEISRTLRQNAIELGIDFVLFDAEDAGANGGGRDETWCLGAQHWARNLTGTKPKYGILLDMVGAKGATFPKEGFSLYYAPSIVEGIWKLAQSMGYGHYFVNAQVSGITDDHRFVNEIAAVPMIDIINYPQGNFGHYHHTHKDDLEIIDKRTLGVVGQVVLAYIFREDAGIL